MQQTVSQAQQQVGQVLSQVQDQAGQIASQVQQQARTQLGGQKTEAAQALDNAAQVVRQVGSQMRQNGGEPLAEYADRAAGQIEQVSHYLHEHDVDEMFHDLESFARRQPALFIAGGVALGILTARFVKSTGHHGTPSEK